MKTKQITVNIYDIESYSLGHNEFNTVHEAKSYAKLMSKELGVYKVEVIVDDVCIADFFQKELK